MAIPPVSPEENNRITALESYDILDSLPEEDYEDITQLASDICETPIALISLVAKDRQWFKSHHGLDLQETSLEHSFCVHNLVSPQKPLVVEDARLDVRFADNAFVTGFPNIVFYAGSPLVDPNGYVLGSLCVIDHQPKQLTEKQLSALKILAKQVIKLLELRKQNQALKESEERYRLENIALATSRKRFETVLKHAPIGLGLLRGDDHVFELVNDRIADMAGRRAEDIQGKPLLEALPELSRQGLKEIFDSVRSTRQRFVATDIPLQIQRNNQLETAHFYASFEPVQEPDGTVSIVDFSMEITEQLKAQRDLQESESRFRAIFEQAPMAMGQLKGRDLVIELGNPQLFEVWGKDPSIKGMRLIDALPEMQGQPFIKILEGVFDSGEPFYGNGVLAQLFRNGRLEDLYFDFRYTPLRSADGEVTGIMIMAVEVTEQVLSRQRLEKSEARFRGLIKEAPFAIGVYETSDLVISIANDAMLQFWGRTPEVIGQKLAEALPELEGQPFIPLLHEILRTGQTYRATEEPADLLTNGRLQRYWFNYVYQPIFDSEGKVFAILNSAVNVTDKYLARQELQQSEQRYRDLAAELDQHVQERTQELLQTNQELQRSNENLQQFAYVASHDLQEPLRKIQTFSTLLSKRFAGQLDEQAYNLLERINTAGYRMSSLVSDLLTYSRFATRQQSFDEVSLEAVLAGVLDALSLTIRERKARIQTNALASVKGDAVQLHQLFQNLISNAIKFTPLEKQPEVQIQYELIKRNELPPESKLTGPVFHRISVSDQGVGFDEQYLDRIFMVFQRLHNKNEFPGTGIGLSICQQVVENHGGWITAKSQPEEGTTFLVYLPA
ncbi:PAS domain-containing protein [Siphonobacter sp.]|uniref:PAS domain-containing protein n=1 Tax=Siphonobacter sp. TaxID=1869184 RepID=UPI003B3A24AD